MSEYRDDQSRLYIFILVKAETRDATSGFYAPPEERESELKEFREGRGVRRQQRAETVTELRGDWIERQRERIDRGICGDDTVPPRSVIPRV